MLKIDRADLDRLGFDFGAALAARKIVGGQLDEIREVLKLLLERLPG